MLLLIAALGVVVQLKDALNTIWEAPEPEGSGAGVVRAHLSHLWSAVMALGFLLMVSLVVSAALAAVSTWAGSAGSQVLLWQSVNFAVSLVVLTILFAVLFKWFPDVPVRWRDVWPGALASAVLFEAGKLAIAWYIARQGLQSTYGAAASLVVLLIWVYYTAQIVLFGAEISHAYAQRIPKGSRGGMLQDRKRRPARLSVREWKIEPTTSRSFGGITCVSTGSRRQEPCTSRVRPSPCSSRLAPCDRSLRGHATVTSIRRHGSQPRG